MLIGYYDDHAQAGCPKCGFVNCKVTYDNLTFSPRYVDLRHDECGTEWRLYIDEKRVETLRSDSDE